MIGRSESGPEGSVSVKLQNYFDLLSAETEINQYSWGRNKLFRPEFLFLGHKEEQGVTQSPQQAHSYAERGWRGLQGQHNMRVGRREGGRETDRQTVEIDRRRRNGRWEICS